MYKETVTSLTKGNEWVKIQPPCPQKDIDNAEKAVGCRFPSELKALLSEMNGDRYLLLSAKEIVEQTKLNGEVAEQCDEPYGHSLKNLLFFATNGCGDYYCYVKNPDGTIDEASVFVWQHEDGSLIKAAESLTELITKYYHDEI